MSGTITPTVYENMSVVTDGFKTVLEIDQNSLLYGVLSFNNRTGQVTLTYPDVTTALGFTPVTSASPALTGVPTAPTATTGTNTTQLATTAFVQSAISSLGTVVSSFNSRSGAVTLLSSDITGALTYTPANIASPTFSGVPSAPTAATGTNTTQLATTAFVQATVTSGAAGVTSFNTRTGAVSLLAADVTSALTYTPANLSSPNFTGIPTAPTASTGNNTNQLATTAFVTNSSVASFNGRVGTVTLTTADVTAANVGILAGTVGAYAYANPTAGSGPYLPNSTIAGGNLQNGYMTFGGTWRCMGYSIYTLYCCGSASWTPSLWLRIA